MWRLVAFLSLLVALGVAPAAARSSPVNNIAPLAFGMTPDEASGVLNAPLQYLGGRPGSELFIADRSANVPWFYPVQERYSLQFRRGHLTGWKRQWQLHRFLVF
jgi:hypothetical protein